MLLRRREVFLDIDSGSVSKNAASTAVLPLFVTRKLNVAAGVADALASQSSKGENMMTSAVTPAGMAAVVVLVDAVVLSASLLKGKAPEYVNASAPGNPAGGCVRSVVA